MNLSDGGKNRPSMTTIGFRGLESVLRQRGLWGLGLKLNETRDIMWSQPDVVAQMTRIEKLCFDHGIVLLYEPKAHPVFNAAEVLIFTYYNNIIII